MQKIQAPFFEKRDMMLTLIFLRLIGEKFDDGIENLKKELVARGMDINDPNVKAAFIDDPTFTDGTFYLPEESRWSTIINTSASGLNVALDTALRSLSNSSEQLKGCFIEGTFTTKVYGGGQGGKGPSDDDIEQAAEILRENLEIIKSLFKEFDLAPFIDTNTTDIQRTDSMNKYVAKMVEEALKYSNVENILQEGEQVDILGPEFLERLADIKMPATRLEILMKLLRKKITECRKVNKASAKKYKEMLDETIALYHDRRKQLSAQEIGDTQEIAADQIIANATFQAENILKDLNEDKERFRKLGLTFEEMAFYDILIKMRDEKGFEYGEDVFYSDVGIMVNKKIQKLAKKIKELIDLKSSFTDWLNNTNVRSQLKSDIKFCLFDNGYPPIYSQEVFNQVMEQVENYKTYEEELDGCYD